MLVRMQGKVVGPEDKEGGPPSTSPMATSRAVNLATERLLMMEVLASFGRHCDCGASGHIRPRWAINVSTPKVRPTMRNLVAAGGADKIQRTINHTGPNLPSLAHRTYCVVAARRTGRLDTVRGGYTHGRVCRPERVVYIGHGPRPSIATSMDRP